MERWIIFIEFSFPTAGSRLKIGLTSSERREDMRRLVIWMPKVWLSRATRVGRRRLKAAMIKEVKGRLKIISYRCLNRNCFE